MPSPNEEARIETGIRSRVLRFLLAVFVFLAANGLVGLVFSLAFGSVPFELLGLAGIVLGTAAVVAFYRVATPKSRASTTTAVDMEGSPLAEAELTHQFDSVADVSNLREAGGVPGEDEPTPRRHGGRRWSVVVAVVVVSVISAGAGFLGGRLGSQFAAEITTTTVSLEDLKAEAEARIRALGWVGDLQVRMDSSESPIRLNPELIRYLADEAVVMCHRVLQGESVANVIDQRVARVQAADDGAEQRATQVYAQLWAAVQDDVGSCSGGTGDVADSTMSQPGAPRALSGKIVLVEGQFSWGSQGFGREVTCWGKQSQGFGDIDEGTKVYVRDEDGSTVGVGELDAGEREGELCRVPFTVERVPTDQRFYTVEIENVRGQFKYFRSELDDSAWDIELTFR